jgi:hypothetical protein
MNWRGSSNYSLNFGCARVFHTLGIKAIFIHLHTDRHSMKKQFIFGILGAFFGISTAIYVILTAVTPDMTLSGVQAALFSSLGLMGAAIANSETRFAGWMLLSSSVWITLSVPIAGTFSLLYLYTPAIIILGIAAVFCFLEPEMEDLKAPE